MAGEFLANHLETSFEKIDYKTDPEGGISLPVPPFFMFFSSQVLIETQPVPGSEIVVKSRSVKRNGKTRGGWGETFFSPPPPPFPSRARLIFALLVLIRPHYIYYLRAWHRLPETRFRNPLLSESCLTHFTVIGQDMENLS